MYYNEFERSKRMEVFLSQLAYFSVGLDFLVAMATFLVIRGNESYSAMLMVSNYLLTIEVVFTVIIFGLLMGLRHYRKIITGVALASFRGKYPESSRNGSPALFKPVYSFFSFLTGD